MSYDAISRLSMVCKMLSLPVGCMDDVLQQQREDFINIGFSPEDMLEVANLPNNERSNLQCLYETPTEEGYVWNAHYITSKKKEGVRVFVKYDPENAVTKLLIKPSGQRKQGDTKVDGSFKHVLTNCLELSLDSNQYIVLKNVALKRTKDQESYEAYRRAEANTRQEMKQAGADSVKIVSSNDKEAKKFLHPYFHTEKNLGQDADFLLELEKVSSRLRSHQVENICDFIAQVASKLMSMHKTQTHGDLKLANIMFANCSVRGEEISMYTVIDPNTTVREPTMAYNKQEYWQDFVSTPAESNISDCAAFSLEVLISGLFPKEERKAVYAPMADCLAKKDFLVCGHMDDTFAFLNALYYIVSEMDQCEEKKILIDFIKEQYTQLFRSIQTFQSDPSWKGPTAASIKNSFANFCEQHNLASQWEAAIGREELLAHHQDFVALHAQKLIEQNSVSLLDRYTFFDLVSALLFSGYESTKNVVQITMICSQTITLQSLQHNPRLLANVEMAIDYIEKNNLYMAKSKNFIKLTGLVTNCRLLQSAKIPSYKTNRVSLADLRTVSFPTPPVKTLSISESLDVKLGPKQKG